MEMYMSKNLKNEKPKIDINEIVGNLSHEDLAGLAGLSKNGLVSLVEGLLQEIMGKEKTEYLFGIENDKSNGTYHRKLNTSLGQLSLNVPRVRSGEFRSSLLPQKYQRYDESFEDLIFTFLLNGDSKNEIVYKMKQIGISFSEKAYDEIFEFIKNQMESFKPEFDKKLQSQFCIKRTKKVVNF